ERGALTLAGAPRPDRASVQLRELLGDGKAEPEPAVAAGGRCRLLAEALEDVPQEFGADADAGVGDGDHRAIGQPLELDRDRAARGRELDRIRDDVPDDLLEPGRIADDHRRIR